MKLSFVEVLRSFKNEISSVMLLDLLQSGELKAFFSSEQGSEVEISPQTFKAICQDFRLHSRLMKFLMNPDFFLSTEYSPPPCDIDGKKISMYIVYMKKEQIEFILRDQPLDKCIIKLKDDYSICKVLNKKTGEYHEDNFNECARYILSKAIDEYKQGKDKKLDLVKLIQEKELKKSPRLRDIFPRSSPILDFLKQKGSHIRLEF